MPNRPRIGIPVPTTDDLAYNRQCWPDYADAVLASGGDPVEVPLGLLAQELTERAASCNGFVLPGSPADVDPVRYGQSAWDACSPADPAREAVDLYLLEHASVTHKSLLCICFGAQILNVWRGGTLLQDLSYVPVNHSAGRSVAVAHTATVVRQSVLGSLVADDLAVGGSAEGFDTSFVRLSVNSSHHQAVAIPGEGLSVVARCPQDGVIEALEGAGGGGFLVAVQWHPERGFATDPVSRGLFTRFVDEARARTIAECAAAETV